MDTTAAPERRAALAELIKEVERLERRWRHLPSRGEEGFPLGSRAVLESLREHGPETVPHIARRRGTSRQNIQMLVNRLKAEGWVELVNNPAHKRSELVQLTAQGRNAVEQMAAKEAAFLEGLTEQVSPRAVKGAHELLRELGALLGGNAQRRHSGPARSQQAPPAHSVAASAQPASTTPPPAAAEEELPVSLL